LSTVITLRHSEPHRILEYHLHETPSPPVVRSASVLLLPSGVRDKPGFAIHYNIKLLRPSLRSINPTWFICDTKHRYCTSENKILWQMYGIAHSFELISNYSKNVWKRSNENEIFNSLFNKRSYINK